VLHPGALSAERVDLVDYQEDGEAADQQRQGDRGGDNTLEAQDLDLERDTWAGPSLP